ncbi:MAG: hypothetical protein AMJ55_03180 [Gammaproteobacteria bacterium SG8_15]|nr:MAG: hypothetical protein AMJ55_03180 [Gammaproteobacteria bacterium SG8_15]
MELSSEDSLRLNVLIKQDLHAVKIDESKMVVHALTGRGEAKIPLNPTCRDEKYLRIVREMLSTHALGSPGGYPVYLRRWTRMGQMREESLQGLLLLGEPEAIVAVANSPELTKEVARRAWWAMPDADIARRMLSNTHIAESDIGRELAAFLVEYLPFETEAYDIVESVRLVLQPGLIDQATVQSLWSRANRKSAFYVGFLLANPDALPETAPASQRYDEVKMKLQQLSVDNPYAKLLLQLLSAEGQAYVSTLGKAMDKLNDQHVVVLFLKAIENYFQDVCIDQSARFRSFDEIVAAVNKATNDASNSQLQLLMQNYPEYRESLLAMLNLACVCESLVDPIFSQTDAVGSVMRKRLQPVTQPITENIRCLM